MSEIYWPAELRKIERQFDGLPPEPSPALQRARREGERRAERRKQQRAAALAVAARLLLVGALGGALRVWPYPRACGLGLFAYMGAEAVIIVGGLWVAAATWRHRMAKMHAVGVTVVVCGLALVTAEVLPRVGYAKVDSVHPPAWRCAKPAIPAQVR